MTAALSLDAVAIELGGRAILQDVSFRLGAGELCGLVGANGSGKTTLLRTIAGFLRPSRGSVTRAAAIGYVPQRSVLDPNLPVRARDVVALGLDGHRWGVPLPSRARRRAVDAILDAVEARAFADARVGELSGGEQQRILIAHALIRTPSLLLLDEPLANLDIGSVAVIVALLRRIAADAGVAVLLSTHDVNPLMGAMDRLVYLARGRAASGTADEVIRTSVLSALYGHHVDVLRVHGRVVVVAGDFTPHDHHAESAIHAEIIP